MHVEIHGQSLVIRKEKVINIYLGRAKQEYKIHHAHQKIFIKTSMQTNIHLIEVKVVYGRSSCQIKKIFQIT